MGLKTTHHLVCDRCGAEVAANPKWGGGLADAIDDIAGSGCKWKKVDDRRALCPDCIPAYEAMIAEHAREVAEFFHEA